MWRDCHAEGDQKAPDICDGPSAPKIIKLIDIFGIEGQSDLEIWTKSSLNNTGSTIKAKCLLVLI
jgi:hypothetical protein